jgi:tellurite resistance protein
MIAVAQSLYNNTQITAWLRGLLTIAWVDGQYDPEEQDLITQITKKLATSEDIEPLEPITPEELASTLGQDQKIAENFLRTGVLVAIADGVYSTPEAELLQKFSNALGLEIEALKSLEYTLYRPEENESVQSSADSTSPAIAPPSPNLLHPIKDWLDKMDINDPRLARFICKMVPSQCPFERDVKVFGHKIIHIPPLCKLNPIYEQLVGLRFRALSYLADECQEDVSEYI